MLCLAVRLPTTTHAIQPPLDQKPTSQCKVTTSGSNWPNNFLTLTCFDEDFILTLCVDEKRASYSHKGWLCPVTSESAQVTMNSLGGKGWSHRSHTQSFTSMKKGCQFVHVLQTARVNAGRIVCGQETLLHCIPISQLTRSSYQSGALGTQCINEPRVSLGGILIDGALMGVGSHNICLRRSRRKRFLLQPSMLIITVMLNQQQMQIYKLLFPAYITYRATTSVFHLLPIIFQLIYLFHCAMEIGITHWLNYKIFTKKNSFYNAQQSCHSHQKQLNQEK